MARDKQSTRCTMAIETKLASLNPIARERCMYKVHEELRDVKEKAYQPMLLAIGPYNNQDKVGQGFMKEHKLRYLQQMLQRTKHSVETYMEALMKLEGQARKCYAECISQYSSDEFVEMMLLDGCFIIELFHKYHTNKQTRVEDDPIFHMTWVRDGIARDLLLFENQLPFFVLAELFKKSNRSRSSGEHIVDIENTDGVESSTSTHHDQIIQTQSLDDLALGFFSDILPFRWNVNALSYNSTKTIEDLLHLACEARTHSLPLLVRERIEVGFRFKNKQFEHLLGLIHAAISISILDAEIKRQEVGNKLKGAGKIFETYLFGPIRKAIISYANKFQDSGFQDSLMSNSINMFQSVPFALDFQEAQVELNLVKHFQYKIIEIQSWSRIHRGIELQEAGIELKQAKKFISLCHDQNRNEDWKAKRCKTGPPQTDGVELKASQKFKRLLCLNKIDCWKSIPNGKELREAGVKLNKAKKFKHLLDLKEIDRWNIYGATELEEAGIKFKKAKECNEFYINFNNGQMEISPLAIGDKTETYLRNLIAYEQYSDKDKDFSYITNYVCFMDDLIDSPKDVKLLRHRGIIKNKLGDDEVVSDMVNKLSHNITISTKNSIYARTSMEINRHCMRKRNLWMAKLRHDYFNSPWALISFLAAVVLLALTIVQTVFSIIN